MSFFKSDTVDLNTSTYVAGMSSFVLAILIIVV